MILLMNARREVIVIRKKIAVKNPVLKNGVHYMTSDYKTRNSGRDSHSGIDMIGKNYAADYIISRAGANSIFEILASIKTP